MVRSRWIRQADRQTVTNRGSGMSRRRKRRRRREGIKRGSIRGEGREGGGGVEGV